MVSTEIYFYVQCFNHLCRKIALVLVVVCVKKNFLENYKGYSLSVFNICIISVEFDDYISAADV